MRILFLVEPFIVEPLGIAYLASVLKKNGYETYLLKIPVGKEYTPLVKEVKTIKPHILALSTTTGKHRKYLEVNREIKKEYPVITVMGGAHPTYYPDVIYDRGIDFIIRGEGEKSFLKLLRKIELMKNTKRVIDFYDLEQDIDRIPLPDREFLYKYPENRNNPIKNVITSRGCRFSCPYCFNSLYRSFYNGQDWVRYRSVENVIKECVELKKYPLKLIFFQDDEFLTNPNRDELLEEYKKKVKVPFHCQIRVEFLNEEIARKLKDAGCISVTYAVESGCEQIRREVLKRYMTKEQIINGAKILRKVGLGFRVENMVGIPGENYKNMLETFELNKQLKATISWCSIFQPYEGLPLAEYAKRHRFWNGQMSEIKDTFFEDTVLNTAMVKEISNMQRLFALGVYLRLPIWLFEILIKMPRNRFYNWIYKKFKYWRYDVMYRVKR